MLTSPAGAASGSAGWVDLNRTLHTANLGFNAYVATPLGRIYNSTVPQFVRIGVYNAFGNLGEPMIAFSSALQGDLVNAGNASGRFAINSTLGIAGFYDVATNAGFASRQEDLGQALCASGWGEGPYVVLPLLGGGSMRDAVGQVASIALSLVVLGPLTPVYWFGEGAARYFRGLERADAAPVTRDFDQVRARILETRRAQCRDGAPQPGNTGPIKTRST